MLAVFMPLSATSPLGSVCRLPMNNSWHDHHRPRICACRRWIIIHPTPTWGQLFIGCLPRLEGNEQLGVMAGHPDADGGPGGDVGGDGKGGCRLVWDLSRGRGAVRKPSHQEEMGGRRPHRPFPQKCLSPLWVDTQTTHLRTSLMTLAYRLSSSGSSIHKKSRLKVNGFSHFTCPLLYSHTRFSH